MLPAASADFGNPAQTQAVVDDMLATEVDRTMAAIDSIIIAWLAFQNQSSLAADALVECVITLWREGASVGQLQLDLSFLALQRQDDSVGQISDLDTDMLLSFVALIMFTCEELECERSTAAESIADQGLGGKLDGLRGFVKQTLQQYANGATLARVRAQQERSTAHLAAGSTPGPSGPSPNLKFMQNATRVILLAVETLQQRGQVQPRAALIQKLRRRLGMAEAPSPPPAPLSARSAPVSFAAHLDTAEKPELAASHLLKLQGSLSHLQMRWLAVRCLLCFMGATMGWAFSWEAFIDAALLAYMAGVSAQDLFDALDIEEFSQAGSIFRAAAGASVNTETVNAEAFARWLSVAYMSWGWIGVPHPSCNRASGWAWVRVPGVDSSAIAANALSQFVQQTLVRLDREEAEAGQLRSPEDDWSMLTAELAAVSKQDSRQVAIQLDQVRERAVKQRIDRGFMFAKVADDSLAASSTAMQYMSQQLSVVQEARRLVQRLQARLASAPSVT